MRTAPDDDLTPWFQTLDDVARGIAWAELFDGDCEGQPVELDIGCGRGLFLARAAIENPQTNFLGLEKDYKEGRHSARKLAKRRLPNARVLGGDARVALGSLIAEASVRACHVYFPDPWWKRRHRRKRIFTDEFVELLVRVLEPAGEVHSWTDVADYFEVIEALMNHHPRFEALPIPAEHSPEHDLDYRTSFERKKRKEGETIYRGAWKKL